VGQQGEESAPAGLLIKEALDALGLVSFPKTSGSRGLHVFVPLRVGPDFDEVLAFSRELCERLAAAHPKELTVEQRIEARKGRVYLDSLRNGFGATVVAPYSLRRREKAPFSTPLAWKEVKPSLVPSNFNLGNYEKRLAAPDPWADFFNSRQSIKSAAKKASKI
jgi:bifunctional non-homologous end joining protein LigD